MLSRKCIKNFIAAAGIWTPALWIRNSSGLLSKHMRLSLKLVLQQRNRIQFVLESGPRHWNSRAFYKTSTENPKRKQKAITVVWGLPLEPKPYVPKQTDEPALRFVKEFPSAKVMHDLYYFRCLNTCCERVKCCGTCQSCSPPAS